MPPMPQFDLQGKRIADTYGAVVQIRNNKLYDGRGNLIIDLDQIGAPIGNEGNLLLAIPSGTSTILQVDNSLYKSAFIDYVLFSNTGQRSGKIILNYFNNDIEFSEIATNDLGVDTSAFEFSAITNSGTFDLKTTSPNNLFSLKLFYKYI